MDEPVPQNLEETVEVFRERLQQIDEQIVEVPIPQISDDSVGEFKVVPQSNLRNGSVNRSWTCPFRRLRRLNPFSFNFVRYLARFRGRGIWQGRVFDKDHMS